MKKVSTLLLAVAPVAVSFAPSATAQADFKKSYASDMEAFVDEMQAKKCRTDADFMLPVYEGIACLRDALEQRAEESWAAGGETLARDLVRYADARIFGTVSAGSSTSKRSWTFPSGIATIRYSARSRSGLGDKVIEFHGIAPHEVTEVVPEEALAGMNSSPKRAEEYLLER
jgi:hypothetical protein